MVSPRFTQVSRKLHAIPFWGQGKERTKKTNNQIIQIIKYSNDCPQRTART